MSALSRVPRPMGYHWDLPRPVVRKDGRPPCRWCKGPCYGRRTRYCKDGCRDEWMFRTRTPCFRARVFARDEGVCALCSVGTAVYDVKALVRGMLINGRALAGRPGAWASWETPPVFVDGEIVAVEDISVMVLAAVRWHVDNRHDPNLSPWEADHVTPVVEGGDYFDMDNIRTLCVPCHRRQTRALRARLKAARDGGPDL